MSSPKFDINATFFFREIQILQIIRENNCVPTLAREAGEKGGGGYMDFLFKFLEMREKGNFLPDMEIKEK